MSRLTDRQVTYLAAAGYMGFDRANTSMDRTWRSLRLRGLVNITTLFSTHASRASGNLCKVTVIEVTLTLHGEAYVKARNPLKLLEVIDRSNASEPFIKGFARIYMIRYLPQKALPRFLTHKRLYVRDLAKRRWERIIFTGG